MKTYVGRRSKTGKAIVFVIGHEGDSRLLNTRLDLFRHSYDFEWGYGGSGPSQLALAILADIFGKGAYDVALKLHLPFKDRCIAKLRRSRDWTLREQDIMTLLGEITRTMESRS